MKRKSKWDPINAFSDEYGEGLIQFLQIVSAVLMVFCGLEFVVNMVGNGTP